MTMHYFINVYALCNVIYFIFKYNMIFAPFTGKDNYGKCVTFAAILLSREDVESYAWILQNFQDCVGKAPKLLITVQDPAIKIAVEHILPHTRHRFCMWHIMLKVADKIPSNLRDDEEFTKKFNGIVWSDHLEPNEFQEQWHVIMEEFGLSSHKWFVKMFNLRSYWIPAYFRNVHLGSLFRTTSMSESENSLFRKYLSKGANLVEFFMHFASAMDAQSNAHDMLRSKDKARFPEIKRNSR